MSTHDHHTDKPCYLCILPPGPSGLIAAGGWCASSGVIADLGDEHRPTP